MSALKVLTLSIYFFAASLSNSILRAEILCNRDAEITAIDPSETTKNDPCTGTVILQGISYECTKLEDVEDRIPVFLEQLRKNGREYCEEMCRKRSTRKVQCHGEFSEPHTCGFTVEKKHAALFGLKGAPCSPHCKGTAFAYCSIFHGSFLRSDPNLLRGNPPNCYCVADQ